jgi:N-formylglutamate deformylase
MTQSIYTLTKGTTPLLISMPHTGTQIPAALAARMTPVARQLDDTDWHLERLYAFARRLGASLLVPANSRYVIDLNRPPDNTNLYPGQNTTNLCPLTTFDGAPLYLAGSEPDPADIAQRLAIYWQPYHQALQGELARLRALHGRARLWEAHSIRSRIPRLFDGELPCFNLGTVDGKSCDAALAKRLFDLLQVSGASAVQNGRFKGGYITRAYGKPQDGVQAIQLELAQRSYMEETPPYAYDAEKAQTTAQQLEQLVQAFIAD